MDLVFGGRIESITKKLVKRALRYIYEIRIVEFAISNQKKETNISFKNIQNLEINIENRGFIVFIVKHDVLENGPITKIIANNNSAMIYLESDVNFDFNVGDYVELFYEFIRQGEQSDSVKSENGRNTNGSEENYTINFTKIKLSL